ncbi:MAG: lanthionine synthetase LanC family protein, partial [Pseudonocardiaceae bacterium]
MPGTLRLARVGSVHTHPETVADPADYGWIDGHAHEIVLPLVTTRPAAPSPLTVARPVVTNRAHGQLPGSPDAAWLNAKIHTHPERLDEIITDQLFRLLDTLDGDPEYWFIRYRSPHETDHLRLRIRTPTRDTYLARLTEPVHADGETLPGWWCRDCPPDQPAHRWPGGHGNLGLAHGIAAPLALLSTAMRRGVTVAGHTEAIERILAWLDHWPGGTGPLTWWPGRITTVERRSGTVAQRGPQRPSWCYGTPGLTRAQQLAALALNDPRRQRQAEDALAGCVTDEHQLAQLIDATLCHGWAGLVHAAWRAAADAADAGGAALSCASVPTIVAMMLDELDIRPDHRILEIGAGTGYNAALLAHLTGPSGQVTTVDIDPEVTARARQALDETGYGHVKVITRDGALGDPENAPYDRIIVTVGAWDLPASWRDQLAPGGRLVVPLRWRGQTRSVAFTHDGDTLRSDTTDLCGFVPMIGQDGERTGHIDRGRQVALYWDADQPVDPAVLCGVLAQPKTTSWSGATVGPYDPF